MTTDEARGFLVVASRRFSAVADALAKPADQHGQAAWLERVDAWKATLADVPYNDALRCLDAIHRGDAGEDLRFPNDWRDRFPATVRRWCRANRSIEFTAPIPHSDDRQPRYRCIDCRDTGFVTAMNAAYAAEHRHLVEGDTPLVRDDEELDPRNPDLMRRLREWAHRARQWCKGERRGAFIATCVCHCEAPTAVAKRQAIAERRIVGCVFKPERMPRVDGEDFCTLWECFERFVQDVRPEDAYTWNPSAPLLGAPHE